MSTPGDRGGHRDSNGSVTGEPDDGKLSRPVRRGADGKGVARPPRQPPTLRQHARRILVAAAFVAPSPSGDPAREPAAVPGILRVRAQRPGPGQEAAGVADRPLARTTLQSILSLPKNPEP